MKGEEALLQLVDATDAAAVNDANARGIFRFHIKAGFSQRLIRCRDGILHEALETTRFFLAQAVLGAIVAANLTCVVNLESRSVEALDGADGSTDPCSPRPTTPERQRQPAKPRPFR